MSTKVLKFLVITTNHHQRYHIAVNNIKAVTFIACILCGIAIYLAEHLPEVKESLV